MTTITTDMLRYIAHTLGTTPERLFSIIRPRLGVTIDDTPADTEEQTMGKMTITQEQADRIADSLAANRVRMVDVLKENGFTITPAEPPAEMVKLAEDTWKAAPAKVRNVCGEHSWQDGFVAALQHAVDVVKGARRIRAIQSDYIERELILNALGAGGRDAK